MNTDGESENGVSLPSAEQAVSRKRGGRPRWKPTDEQRKQTRMMSAMGIPLADIAAVLGCTGPTLAKWCRQEIKVGRIEATTKVATSLFKQATDPKKPNVVAGIFWMKAQAGWRDRDWGPSEEETPAKKEQRLLAAHKVGSSGRLSPGRGPRLAVDNTKKRDGTDQ